MLNKIIINQNALTDNFNKFRRIIPRNKKIISVVKANAYGHGLKEIVALIKNDTDYFQVDDIEELRILRNISDKPTLVLGYVQKSDLEELISLNGILGLYSISQAQELNKIGQILNKLIKIHICIDSHLGRDGILASEIEKDLIELKGMQYIQVEGYYSHFANIEDTADRSHAEKQISTFQQVKEVIRSYFPHSYSHISATSGILEYEQISKSNSFVRLGIGLYGIWPSEELRKKHSDNLQLIPVLSLKSKLAQIKILPKNHTVGYGLTFKTLKDMKVGIVPIGYSDGVDRNLSNTGEVLVRGQRCRIIGRISMNMLTIDLSKVTNVEVEDEVILIGKQQNEEITAEEIAHKIGTINYEVLARLSPFLQKTLDSNIHE
jgi:alanine racemase